MASNVTELYLFQFFFAAEATRNQYTMTIKHGEQQQKNGFRGKM